MHNDSDPSDLPDSLRDALRRTYGGSVRPDPSRDQQILNIAKAHYLRRGRRTRLMAAVASAAAVIAVVATVFVSQRPASTVAFAPHDVDRDGQVNIIDALAAAQALQADGAVDVNGDGVRDRRDVEAVARTVVNLAGEARP